MIFRKCRKCGRPMDPGEGYGNVCDDCIRLEERKRDGGKEEAVRIYISPGGGCPRKQRRNALYRLEAGAGGGRKAIEGSVELCATANRAELAALSAALAHFHRACRIVIHTKSPYIANAFKQNWAFRWASSGWRNAKGKPVANQKEWKEALKALKGMTFQIVLDRGAD